MSFAQRFMVLIWLCFVAVLASSVTAGACSWQASGLEFRPYRITCLNAMACNYLDLCENGECYSYAGCVGWWQECVWQEYCDFYSRCANTISCA
jgi:hypothetical protein